MNLFETSCEFSLSSLTFIPHDVAVQDTTVNLFETTIRILGGLLSAFYLTGGDRIYLYKAVELGMRMTPGFHSPSGIDNILP